MTVGPGMLVEMEHGGRTGRVVHGHPRLLDRLADRCILGCFAGLDVAAGLEPPFEAPVEVQQDPAGPRVDDDGRRRDVRRQGAAEEGVGRSRSEAPQVLQCLRLLVIDGRVAGEGREQPREARVGDRTAQVSTSFARTAPVLSSS